MLSNPQRYKYFQLAHDAYEVESARLCEELPAFDEWRHKIQLDTTGCFSIKEMNHTDHFDAVMLELAIIAEDIYWINRLSSAAERRIRYVIEKQFLPDLEFLEQQSIGWEYVKGICNHMAIPDKLQDCPAEQLIKVLQALDTHIRRLARKAEPKVELIDLPSGYFRRGIRPVDAAQAHYRHDHHHHVKHGAAA